MIAQWLHILQLPADRHDKPRVGVSACLLGDAVRYDGDNKRNARISDHLAPWLHTVRLCPEVAIGLPVPRPPVHVVQVHSGQRVRRPDNPALDFTDALRANADSLPADLDGFILKARSPSCGVGTTPLHDVNGRETGSHGNGAFADALLARALAAPVVNETHLDGELCEQLFLLKAYLHQALRTSAQADTTHWRQACGGLPDVLATPLRTWLAALPARRPMLQSAQTTCGAP